MTLCVRMEIPIDFYPHAERCKVKLRPSDETVEIRSSDLGELADKSLEDRKKRLAVERSSEGGTGRGSTGGASGRGEVDRGSEKEDKGRGGALRSSIAVERVWLFPRIKVRVVDKKVSGGKLYLKKGEVIDVYPGAMADVSMDEGGQVLQLHQEALETVLPKEEGAVVMVVAGRLRGSKGRLLKKHPSEGVAAIQVSFLCRPNHVPDVPSKCTEKYRKLSRFPT